MDAVEQDDHNFSTPSSHRLPTLSGTQAIRNARRNAQPIPTSLVLLDNILGRASNATLTSVGGIQRGLVTEVFGPPGVGKTTFALQVAVNALHASADQTSVTWIDTSSQLLWARVKQLTDGYQLPSGHDPASSPPRPQLNKDVLLEERFNYLQVTTLPKLLALLLYPSSNFPLPNTHLIVLDDISNLILASLPRSARSASTKDSHRVSSSVQDAALTKRALSRRFQVLSSFASSLQKFAAANNVAILVTSKATVNFKVGQPAVLRPALTSQQWDNYLSVRIALYRDFWPHETSAATQMEGDPPTPGPTAFEKRSLRFARVTRLAGKLVSSPEVGFVIEEGGLRGVDVGLDDAEVSVVPMATQPLRPLEDVLESGINEGDEPADEPDEVDDSAVMPALETALPERSGNSKRKAIEIADSEDENEGANGSDDDLSLPPIGSQHNEFRSSSQVFREGSQGSTAKKLVADTVPAVDEHDEMLLDTYEKEAPPFSQAAADMSEPLTPSDDERDMS